MYTPENIAALVAIITEQRETITRLTNELNEANECVERNWTWYKEEREQVKALETKVEELSAQLNQPRI